MSGKLTHPALIEHLGEMGVDTTKLTNKEAMTLMQGEKALFGNQAVFQMFAAFVGELPDNNVNINVNKKLEDFLE